jgi:selenide,water dikinase
MLHHPLVQGARLGYLATGAGGDFRGGFFHDAVGRHQIRGAQITGVQRALLCDPQTSGELLVASSPEAVPAVLEVFERGGLEGAAMIGSMTDGPAQVTVGV